MEIRQNQVVQGDQGTRKGSSEGSACKLEEREKAKMFKAALIYLEVRHLPVTAQTVVHVSVLTPVLAHG